MPQDISPKLSGSPFVPGDLVSVKSTEQQGTIMRIPSQYYSEVHVEGRRLMLPNDWLIRCNSEKPRV
jgi:hypothetical protein